eukprot:3710111-Pyramimonas_sp.AAC.1
MSGASGLMGGPTESTTLLGRESSSAQASGPIAGWPSAASYTPPEATALWCSPDQQGDKLFDSGTDTDACSLIN